MKHFLLTGLLLGGSILTAQAQGGYQDDVYSSAPVPGSSSNRGGGSSSGNSNSNQRQSGGSFNDQNYNNNGGGNGNGYNDGYADDYDYIDYQNDGYYSSRFRRFNDPFYNGGYWNGFGSPWGYGGGFGGYGVGFGGYGYGWGSPGINISIGYGGPYWSSYWGWNNWYGYGGFASYWNYPYYAGGWGGNPWLGYGGGYNNGYWNGYYAGLYGAGVGYGNGYNAGYRNVTYGPRGGGLSGGYSGYRSRVVGTDGYRMATPATSNGSTIGGITDGGRRVRTDVSGGAAPVERAGATPVLNDRVSNNNSSVTDRAVPVNRNNGFQQPAGIDRAAGITRDGNEGRITEAPATRTNRFERNDATAVPERVNAPRGGWFEERGSRSTTTDRQPVQEAPIRNNNWGNDNGSRISDRPVRSYEQPRQTEQPRFEQPRTMPQRSFEQPRQIEQPRQTEQPRFEQPRAMPQRSFEQPRQMEQPRFEQPRAQPQRSFERPQMSTPSRSYSTPAAPRGGSFGGGSGGMRGGGMRR